MKISIRRWQVSIKDRELEYYVLWERWSGSLLFLMLAGDEHTKRFFHLCGVKI